MDNELYGMSPMMGSGPMWPSTPQEEMLQQQKAATEALDKKQQVANAMLRQQIARPEGLLGQTRVGRSKIARPSLDQGFGAVGTMLGTGANKLLQSQQRDHLASYQQLQRGLGKEQEALGQQAVDKGQAEYLAEQERLRQEELAKQAEQSGVGFSLE